MVWSVCRAPEAVNSDGETGSSRSLGNETRIGTFVEAFVEAFAGTLVGDFGGTPLGSGRDGRQEGPGQRDLLYAARP